MTLIFEICGKKFEVENDFSSFFVVKSRLKDYDVEYRGGQDTSETVDALLTENPKNVLFCDKRLYEKSKVKHPYTFMAEANEDFKTIEGATKLIDFLQESSFSKSENLIVVGGGTIQDVAAFVGGTFKRGITWYFVPTTLLAMCDSCIGAKASINYRGVKNQLGLFNAPNKVIINPNFISSLARTDISNGLGEILKLCLIGGHDSYSLYKKLVVDGNVESLDEYRRLILTALAIKKAVIEVDEFDLGVRKVLNYGHTFGHAIEVITDYQIPHGQAIAIGMLIVNDISARLGHMPTAINNDVRRRIFDLLSPETTRIMSRFSSAQLEELLLKDKKTMSGKVNLVLVEEVGKTRLEPAEIDEQFITTIDEIIADNFKKS
ncbi:MAG: hypothetical protein WC437_02425 [Patescibacteria group bacterium]